jgi:hypothetical protein
MPSHARCLTGWLACLLALAGCSTVRPFTRDSSLRDRLTFHASFDRGTDADFALGDPWIYHAPAMDQWDEAQPGLPDHDTVQVAPAEGHIGGALYFPKRTDLVVFYRATENVRWRESDWGGTVSFWLRADPERLPEGFCDPIQITPRGWNDAALFVEFEKRDDVVFRLGAYPNFSVWNPANLEWSAVPPERRPLAAVVGPPFKPEQWIHVAFTWNRFNTGQPDGLAVLYLDGAQVGVVPRRTQTFTWNPANSRLLLGVGFVGWIDEVAAFDRALSLDEIRSVRALTGGIRSLR